jgi:hypothetical protein
VGREDLVAEVGDISGTQKKATSAAGRGYQVMATKY